MHCFRTRLAQIVMLESSAGALARYGLDMRNG